MDKPGSLQGGPVTLSLPIQGIPCLGRGEGAVPRFLRIQNRDGVRYFLIASPEIPTSMTLPPSPTQTPRLPPPLDWGEPLSDDNGPADRSPGVTHGKRPLYYSGRRRNKLGVTGIPSVTFPSAQNLDTKSWSPLKRTVPYKPLQPQ